MEVASCHHFDACNFEMASKILEYLYTRNVTHIYKAEFSPLSWIYEACAICFKSIDLWELLLLLLLLLLLSFLLSSSLSSL